MEKNATALNQAKGFILLLVLATEHSQAELHKTVPIDQPDIIEEGFVAPALVKRPAIHGVSAEPLSVELAIVHSNTVEPVTAKSLATQQQTTQSATLLAHKRNPLHSTLVFSQWPVAQGNIGNYRAGLIVDRSSYTWNVGDRGISIQKHF